MSKVATTPAEGKAASVTMWAAALDYAAKGIPVFPCERFGKRPATSHGFKDRTTDAAQIEAIVAYLVENFGPGAKVQMNSAPLEEIKVVLGFSVPEAQAVVEYRESRGPYREWRDVLKAPGINASKVESMKDAMAF